MSRPEPGASASRSAEGREPGDPHHAADERVSREPPSWRPWPRSLFGRLMLVLALGLMAAQLIGAAINLVERDELVARGYGVPMAQRIADVVRLLDGLPDAERRRVAAVLSAPPLVLSLTDVPGLPEARPAGADRFARRLQAALADDRAVRVAPRPPGPADQRSRAEAHAERRAERRAERLRERLDARRRDRHERGLAEDDDEARTRHDAQWRHIDRAGRPIWRTEVQLADGRWARFDAALPPEPERLPWRLVTSLAVLLLSVLALSWLAVHWLTRPLKLLAGAAQSLGEDIDRPPLPETGPTEVRQAAQAFNTMQQRLQAQMRERTRLLTALSHDLKTPLTRMRLRAELLDDDEARGRFESDLGEMEAMVTETLDFMRGFGGHEPRSPVDVNALVADVVDGQTAMGRRVQASGLAGEAFTGVGSLIKRALVNLVDNAVLYGASAAKGADAAPSQTPAAAAVQVCIDDAPEALTLRVLDAGPGIPESELAAVFEPFHRLETSRNRETGGTGLGLAIARDIARMHGGTLTLHNRPEGGLEARLVLPRRAAP
jgi:signal transduction histidine kinase